MESDVDTKRPRDVQQVAASKPSAGVRTIVSLSLFVHLFCVLVVLSANLAPSPLLARLVDVFAPYTQTLNFDPNFTPYHLTHGIPEHDDHLIEVESLDHPASEPIRLGGAAWRGTERHKRYQRLAYVLSFFAGRDLDAVSSELARTVGDHVMTTQDTQKVVVRCLRHRPQSMEPGAQDPADPLDRQYYETVYEADVWVADDASTQVLKRSERREVAPTVKGSE